MEACCSCEAEGVLAGCVWTVDSLCRHATRRLWRHTRHPGSRDLGFEKLCAMLETERNKELCHPENLKKLNT